MDDKLIKISHYDKQNNPFCRLNLVPNPPPTSIWLKYNFGSFLPVLQIHTTYNLYICWFIHCSFFSGWGDRTIGLNLWTVFFFKEGEGLLQILIFYLILNWALMPLFQSTLKVKNYRWQKLLTALPGHANTMRCWWILLY